ncbi:acetyltransferase (GNAT) family protein [Saccharothrix australiensis]|uniref:Acetyltransferase (GNAT) family protein n=1 Tax=Saccharothrix australiensis TaxID=2072 RepID=A0A495VWA7_9PSEU|nr:acetyltransferase (GNAT) family protein [Saccharothrix australiensis]
MRAARPGDVAAAAELRWRWAEEVHGTPDLALDEFTAGFTAWAARTGSSHRCLVAARCDRVVGMAWLAITPRVPHPRSFERGSGDLQCVYVRPSERGRGVGARLIGAALALARELGLERVTVHSSARAVSAYARGGFEVSPHLLQAETGRPGYAR